ncbi:MAG: hypothetical protein JNK02_08795 [Planctomycetes bacterium]|nr:hypothetical protein [Planctomycetota bacterium]
MAERAPWRDRLALAAALVALVLVRGFLVLACADVFFYGEELGKGGVAKAILAPPDIPYHRLVYAYHEGGGFVVAHLRAAAFLVLGESLLATKLVAIGTSAMVLAAGFTLTLEGFGRRAALLFGALFVLCPDAWLRFSLVSIGTHFEALFFQAAILFLALRIARDGSGGARDWLLLGLAAGCGVYFSLVTLAAIAAAGALLVLALRRRLLGRGLAIATVAALVGAAPLWWMLSRVGLDAVRVRANPAVPHEPRGFLTSVADLFVPLVREGRLDDWIQLGLLGPLAAAAIWLVRERRARLAAAGVLLYLGTYFVLYFGSGLAVSMNGIWLIWWRMCPAWLFGCVLAAAALDALLARRRLLGASLVGLFVAAGLADLARLTATGRPDRLFANAQHLARSKGYDLSEYFDQLVHHLDPGEAGRIRTLLEIDEPTHLLPSAAAHNVFEETDLPLARVIAISREAFGPRFEAALLGLGHHLHPRPGYDLRAAFERLGELPEDLRGPLARALGRTGLGQRFRRDRLVEQLEIPVPAEHREAFLVGAGWRVWRAYLLDPEGGEAFIASRPPAERAALGRGLALERAAWTLP